MSYKVTTGTQADRDLANWPVKLQRLIIREMGVLAAAPTALSQPAAVPYESGQLFRAEFPYEDLEVLLDIVFHFSQDEQEIVVARVHCEFV